MWREARTCGTATTSKSRFGGGFRNTQRTQWNVEVPAEPPGTDPRDEGRLGRSLSIATTRLRFWPTVGSGRRPRRSRQTNMILPTVDDPGHWIGIWGGISGGGGGFDIVSGVSRDGAGFAMVTRPSERFLAVARSEIAPDRYPV